MQLVRAASDKLLDRTARRAIGLFTRPLCARVSSAGHKESTELSTPDAFTLSAEQRIYQRRADKLRRRQHELRGAVDAVVSVRGRGIDAWLRCCGATGGLKAEVMVGFTCRERGAMLVEIFSPVRCGAEEQDKETCCPDHLFRPADYHRRLDAGQPCAVVGRAGALSRRRRRAVRIGCRPLPRSLWHRADRANQDGAAGLATIHRLGGRTVGQRPNAYASLMHESALRSSRRLGCPSVACQRWNPETRAGMTAI